MKYILQIGEGNFLRAFAEDYINEIVDYKVVICQPRKNNKIISSLNKQSLKYEIINRGIFNSSVIDERVKVNCVENAFDTVTEYEKIISAFCREETVMVISNTTEAGIFYDENDTFEKFPDCSYPAKLTYLLYARFVKGISPVVILPCELIENNGEKLKECVLKYACLWNLRKDFYDYVNSCAFCNTLVDRIVTGHITGDSDCCSVACEPYKSWIISAPDWAKDVIPFKNVEFVDNINIYRCRKVRILNGLHTMFSLAAYMAGFDIVRDVVNDKLFYEYIAKGCEEIKSTIDINCDEYVNSVIERFKNPFIDHKLYDISLNSVSKYKVRCLDTIIDYIDIKGRLPKCLVFSLAALIAYYLKVGNRNYQIRDNECVLEFFKQKPNVHSILSNVEFWGQDLSKINNFENTVEGYFQLIKSKGITDALKEVLYE